MDLPWNSSPVRGAKMPQMNLPMSDARAAECTHAVCTSLSHAVSCILPLWHPQGAETVVYAASSPQLEGCHELLLHDKKALKVLVGHRGQTKGSEGMEHWGIGRGSLVVVVWRRWDAAAAPIGTTCLFLCLERKAQVPQGLHCLLHACNMLT